MKYIHTHDRLLIPSVDLASNSCRFAGPFYVFICANRFSKESHMLGMLPFPLDDGGDHCQNDTHLRPLKNGFIKIYYFKKLRLCVVVYIYVHMCMYALPNDIYLWML